MHSDKAIGLGSEEGYLYVTMEDRSERKYLGCWQLEEKVILDYTMK
jgi:hypothetical protein